MAHVDSAVVWQLARRANLLKSSNYGINLKLAQNKEKCRKHAFHIRFYYRWIKRPTLKIYVPLRNWVTDYYAVAEDFVVFGKAHPIKGLDRAFKFPKNHS